MFGATRAIEANVELIALAYVPPAHTDKDMWVHFEKGNVLHLSDLFFNGMYPFIDASTAGNIGGMIAAATRLVKPGGRVIFSNCSLDPAEGEELYRAFLAGTEDVVHDPIRAGEIAGAEEFLTREGTLRTTPADMRLTTPAVSGLDGFFAARFRRRA